MKMRRGFLKSIALVLTLLTAAAVCPASAPAAGGTQYVRVLLSTEGATSMSVPVSGSYTLKEASRSFSNGTLRIQGSGSTVTVSHSSEGTLFSGRTATIERTDPGRSGGTLTFKTVAGTRRYLGNFTLTANNGALSVVNRVPLTHYLYGVVAYEMSNDFPLEALKAQAVAAKGYALLHVRSSGSYDIGDTASDQVYRGYEPGYTNVINAVDSTATDLLYYNGQILQCYYAASNGGWAILPGTRWGSKLFDGAFISGADVYDLKNPSSPCEVIDIPRAYTARTMGAAAYSFINGRLMAAAGAQGVIPANYRFSRIKSIDAVEPYGQTGYKGDRNYSGVELRATVEAALLDSAIPSPTPTFPPTPSPTPTFLPTPSPTPTLVPSPTPEATEEPTPEVTEDETDEEVSPEPSATITPEAAVTPSPTPTFPPTPSPTAPHPATPSPTPEPEFTRDIPVRITFSFDELVPAGLLANTRLGIRYAEETAAGFRLVRARYGHGVGMSQRGAQQMASEGKSFLEILAYYYPGATLGTMEYVFPENLGAVVQETAGTAPGAGRVEGGTVNLRAKASKSSKSLGKLEADTALILLGMQNEWYYVQAPDGSLGYVRYDYVRLTGSTMIAGGKTSASAVNYRQGPGTDYPSLGQLSNGTQLGIYGMVDGWYKVRAMTTGQVGFVKKGYLDITEPFADTSGAAASPAPVLTPAPTPVGQTPTPSPEGMTPTPVPTPTPRPANPSAVYAASGVVNGSAVNIRAGASTSTKSYGKMQKGTQLGLYEKSGGWYRVRILSSGQEGYVYARYVSLTEPTTEAASESSGFINASGVQLRTGPSTGNDSLGRLSRNATVTILGSSGSWYHVRLAANGAEGYVFTKYVTMTGLKPADTVYGVITARLNLRVRPTTSKGSTVLLVMPKGAVVTVYSVTSGWAYVNYEGTSGYCLASCVRMG